ncbi:glucose-1-phosphate adenylyltransferase [Nonomuraea sediminis]|uniref:glucose-1-phosphate adenylyltransferase n=1 Tax=Nonomuraea sediminis TaxID=2835864 RepID=UPI001BDDB5CD|nr:glucose-1-phosphate adenylyltransferase [Nonomuraea sediminis]
MTSLRVLAVVLAGGVGRRLMPLTVARAKPAVPFGGMYRLIDFVLSNLTNAGYFKIVVLTQYQSRSLDRYISRSWQLSPILGHHITPVAAQQQLGPQWFTGSADALFQNLHLIKEEMPEHVLVFGADHVYRMDPRQMLAQHAESGADVTVAAIRQPLALAHQFGVIETAGCGRRIANFAEKPQNAVGLADSPDEIYASMGNYVFRTEALIDAVCADALDVTSRHDIGGDIIPMLAERGRADVYDFARNLVPGARERERGYWRDVGTLDAYFEAHMDLLLPDPPFILHNDAWPIRTWHDVLAPTTFLRGMEERAGRAVDALVSPGVTVAGGATIERSVLSPRVTLQARARVENCVLMENVHVGRDAIVRRAIVDKDAVIPDGARIGLDPDEDRARYTVTENGIVVIGGDEGGFPGSGIESIVNVPATSPG